MVKEKAIIRLLDEVGDYRLFFAIVCTSILRTVRDLSCLITISRVITILTIGSGNLTIALLWVVIAELGGMPILALDTYFNEKYTTKSERTLMKKLSSSLKTASFSWLDAQLLADLVSTATSDLERFIAWQRSQLPNSIRNIAYIIGGLIYAFSQSAIMTLAILPIIILIVPVINKFSKPLNENAQKQRKMASKSLSKIQDVLFDPEFVKSYHLENEIDNRIGKALSEQMQVENQAVPHLSIVKTLGRLSGYLPTVVTTIIGFLFLLNGKIEVGFLFGFVQMASQRFGYFIPQISDIISQTHQASASAKRIMDILSAKKEEALNTGTSVDLENDVVFSMENVSFSYTNSEKELTLKNINLQIKKGENIGIVGESGCGKSTLLKILMGLYLPRGGNFECWGKDISKWNLCSLRENIAPVLQNPFLFPLTVRENLKSSNKTTLDIEILEALNKVGLTDYMENLNNGLDTIIEQKGSSLSGGQRQRLTIARTLLKQTPVLIFDEPTSALDTVTQAAFQKMFNEIKLDKTCITVSHRLSLVQECNCIFMMKQGEIIEQGTHEELIARAGSYYQLFMSQEKRGVCVEA